MAALTAIAAGAALASMAASGIGAGIGARKRRKAAQKQQKILGQMSTDNESDFLRNYYQDAFDDPSSRSYLKRASGELYDRSKSIENSGVATGTTHENVLAQKQAANNVMSDAVNNVVVNHEAKKQAAEDQYIRRKDAIASGNMSLAQEKGERQEQNWTNAGNILSKGITDLSSAYVQSGGKLFGGKKAAGNVAGLDGLTQQSNGYAEGFAASQSQNQMNRLENWR